MCNNFLTRRAQLIARIQNLTLSMIKQICSGQLPRISLSLSHTSTSMNAQTLGSDSLGSSNFESSIEDSKQINEETEEPDKKTVTDFARSRSKDKFALMMTVMSTAHRLLITNTTITRRSLYYDLKKKKTLNLVPQQRCVDQAVNHVATLLNCAPWELSESSYKKTVKLQFETNSFTFYKKNLDISIKFSHQGSIV